MHNDIQQAITILKQGGVVIYPTDTAFGIGCRMDDADAVKRLFTIRQRPVTKATPVLVNGKAMAQEYLASLPSEAEKLMDTYWPGALTIVLSTKIDRVPELVRGGGNTIGLRMPDHATALALIDGMGVPLLGPSANFNGHATPFAFAELDPALVKQVDFVLDGVCKEGRVTSTVVDCTQKPWQILREGAVKIQP